MTTTLDDLQREYRRASRWWADLMLMRMGMKPRWLAANIWDASCWDRGGPTTICTLCGLTTDEHDRHPQFYMMAVLCTGRCVKL